MYIKAFVLFNIILDTVAFTPSPGISLFNNWHCIDFVQNIDKTKPHAYNIGELPLVLWFNESNPISSVNLCRHFGSKLDHGTVKNGCLRCAYHGLVHTDKDSFGKTMIYEDKLWWSYEPNYKKPPSVPFYKNKNYATTNIKVDVDASLVDCAFNTMDVNHPGHVHQTFGFGNPDANALENLKSYKYNDEKLGLSFNYKSNSNLVHLKRELKKSRNFHIYEYPYTTWSIVSLVNNQNLIVNVNMLPLGPNKTRWLVTLKHNYWNKYPHEKKLMEFAARCILFQDKVQMSKQALENGLKRMVMYQEVFENEEHMEDMKTMFKKYQYPDMVSVTKLYDYHKKSQK